MASILERIQDGDVFVCDGAMGTYLQEKGIKPGDCPEEWCIEYPETIKEVYQAYRDAGSDIVETNSFGGSRYKLKQFGLEDKVKEINEKAVSLAREVAGDSQYVMATAGPTGEFMEPLGLETEDSFYEAFKEQCTAFENGGADLIIIETMTAIEESAVAVRAAKENTSLPVIASFSFDPEAGGTYASMMGVDPKQFATQIVNENPDIVGTNCGTGPDHMIEIVKILHSHIQDRPLMAMPNAGMPEIENGKTVFKETPKQMAAKVPKILQEGVSIIGGCCGTGAEHIQAIKNAVS